MLNLVMNSGQRFRSRVNVYGELIDSLLRFSLAWRLRVNTNYSGFSCAMITVIHLQVRSLQFRSMVFKENLLKAKITFRVSMTGRLQKLAR